MRIQEEWRGALEVVVGLQVEQAGMVLKAGIRYLVREGSEGSLQCCRSRV